MKSAYLFIFDEERPSQKLIEKELPHYLHLVAHIFRSTPISG